MAGGQGRAGQRLLCATLHRMLHRAANRAFTNLSRTRRALMAAANVPQPGNVHASEPVDIPAYQSRWEDIWTAGVQKGEVCRPK